MARLRTLRRIALLTGVAGLLAACAGVIVGRPTPVPGNGPLGVPQPTASQIAVGQNPTPSAPRMNPFVAELKPRRGAVGGDPYAWLQEVHSSRTRHWISRENRATRKAMAALPGRAWIRSRLAQLEADAGRGADRDVVVERVFYLTPDGTRLPMEIAHRRDLTRDGNQPALLAVYHPIGKPPAPLLRPFVLVWLEMGGVYARAEVRNGLAPAAAAAAAAPGAAAATPRMPDRAIALSDLYAAGRSLIDQRYTRRERLGIYGRGFGGLMAGAAITARPDFFGLALPTGTWVEYRRITSGDCYPPTLIVTGEHDGTIRPWRGYELAAVLQAEQLCRHPILIRVDRDEGPEAPAAQRLEAAADQLAFAAKWLGALPPH